MTLPRPPHDSPSPQVIEIATQRIDSWFPIWIGGVMLPIALGLCGARWVWLRHATIPNLRFYRHLDPLGRTPWIEFAGIEGVFLGLVLLFAACGFHFHWSWRAHPKLVYFSW